MKRACIALEKARGEGGSSDSAVRAVREVFESYRGACASQDKEAQVWEAEFTMWNEMAGSAHKAGDEDMAKAAEAAMLTCAESAQNKGCDTLVLVTKHVEALLRAPAGKGAKSQVLVKAEERARAATHKYPTSVEAWGLWVRVHARCATPSPCVCVAVMLRKRALIGAKY